MTKYYLSVKNKNNFKKINDLNYVLGNSLEDIDEFTSSYNNEEELKEELGKLYGIKIDGKIVISYKIKRHGIEKTYELRPFYSNGYKIMLNEDGIVSPKNIENYILGKLGDFPFLKELASFYYNSGKNCPQNSNYFSIINYINATYTSSCNNIIYNEFNIGIRNLIERETKKTNGEVNYSGLRRLVMFIIKYNEKMNLDKFRNEIKGFKKISEPKRYPSYADIDDYPGDLELGYKCKNSSYIKDDEEFIKRR